MRAERVAHRNTYSESAVSRETAPAGLDSKRRLLEFLQDQAASVGRWKIATRWRPTEGTRKGPTIASHRPCLYIQREGFQNTYLCKPSDSPHRRATIKAPAAPRGPRLYGHLGAFL